MQVIERIRAGGLLFRRTVERENDERRALRRARDDASAKKHSSFCFTSVAEYFPSRSDVPSSSEGASNARSRSRLLRRGSTSPPARVIERTRRVRDSKPSPARRLCRSPERGARRTVARGAEAESSTAALSSRRSFAPKVPLPARGVLLAAERVHPPPSQKVTHPLSVNTPRRRRLFHPSSFF